MTENVIVTKVINQVQIASDGPQGPTGPSGVISVTAPITNTGTSTSAVIGINAGVAGGVATLDGTGKVPQNQLPAVAITNTFVVNSQAAMLALTAEEGDVAVRTDLNKSFILSATPSSTLANWQELLTPTDSVLSVDGLTGAVDLTTKYAQLATANTFTGGVQQITTASAATKGLIIRGASGQTANLQEWQNSTGGLVAYVSSGGLVATTSASVFTTLSDSGATRPFIDFGVAGTLLVNARTATNVGWTVRGAASQTANLQEWQNSAGSVLMRLNASGQLQAQQVQSIGAVFGGSLQDNSGTGSYINATSTDMQVLTRAATNKFVVRGAASQTANLTEWQDSTGTVIARVESTGAALFGGASGTRIDAFGNVNIRTGGSQYNGANLSVNTVIAGVIGVIVRGSSGQTADLQQWQNSAGAVLASITSAGLIAATNAVRVPNNVFFQAVRSTGSAAVDVMGFGSGSDTVRFRTGTSTGDLFIFQTSGGGTRFRVNNDGQVLGDAASAPSFGGGAGVVSILNATTVPTTNPSGGGVLYVEAGALKYRGSSGTITTLGAA